MRLEFDGIAWMGLRAMVKMEPGSMLFCSKKMRPDVRGTFAPFDPFTGNHSLLESEGLRNRLEGQYEVKVARVTEAS